MADLTLNITIPDANVIEAKAAFLKRNPKPTDEDHPDFGLNDKQWLEKWISQKINREIQLGKREMDTPVVSDKDYFAV